MAAQVLPQGKQYFETSAGIPAVGWKLYTTDTGTANPRTTWLDAAQVTPNANPVVLDARGEAVIFWSGTYRVRLEDNLGNTIWTVDGVGILDQTAVLIADLATSNNGAKGAGLVGFGPSVSYAANTVGSFLNSIYGRTAAESAAGITPANYFYPPGHVLRYGTNTTPGTTDMASAITQAIASWNGTGGKVTFPAGTLAFASQILVTARGIQWVGEGCSDLNGTGSANRGATCLLRTFAGTAVSGIIFNADDCGIDLIDIDGNLQGTKCHNLEVWGSRFSYGRVSSRNASGRGQRFGRDDSASGGNSASRANVNFLSVIRAISCGNLAGGILFDDQNLTTSLSYPLGAANVNACQVGVIDARSNGTQYNISGITNAANAVVTINQVSAANPIAVGDAVSFANVFGMLQINSVTTLQACNVTAVGGVSGAWTATINVDTTAYAAYGGGGQLGVGPGVEIWNANDICFQAIGSQANFGPGIRFRSDGTNVVSRCHHVLLNDSEANIAPDIQIDGGTLPLSGPGAYNVILGNRSVAVSSRIVDNSSGSLVMQWLPGLLSRAYHFGPVVNTYSPTSFAGFVANVGANAAPAGLFCVSSGTIDSIARIATHKNGGALTNGLEVNQYAVFKSLQDLFAVTYGASMTIDAATGNFFQITASTGAAFTLNAPTNPQSGTEITIQIRNTSGGVLGAVTWDAVFKLAAWVSPATGFSRSITYRYNGTNWIEVSRISVDVPN